MIWGLFQKELRQHGWLLGLLVVVLISVEVLFLQNRLLGKLGGSAFYMVGWLWLTVLPLVTLVLGSRLIATEFRQKTQLFLEGLPMPRWLMLAVKYAFGLGVAICGVSLVLAIAWKAGSKAEAMTPNFALLLWVKSLGWAWFCWAVCFLHGFLGRYRAIVGFLIVFGLLSADPILGLNLGRMGPFELISDRFAYERFVWPTAALQTTGALIACLSFLGFVLGLVRDASVAGLLAEKMSGREKIVITGMLLAGLMTLGSVQQRKEAYKPLSLPGSVDVRQGAAQVSVAAAVANPSAEVLAAQAAHAHAAAGMLAEAAAYLGCHQLPPVFLVHREDYVAGKLEYGDLGSFQGSLVRVNLLLTPVTNLSLQTTLLQGSLSALQHGRLYSDTRGWVLRGFAAWWPCRKTATTVQTFLKDQLTNSDLHNRQVTATDLQRWLHYETTVPNSHGASLAGTGILVLGEAGEAARQQFLSSVLNYRAPRDFRASLHDWLNPVEGLLQRTVQMDLDEFANKWTQALKTGEAKPSQP